MKRIILLLFHTLLFASSPNEALHHYQEKYTLCQGETNFKISDCILNGNLNYTHFRGDLNAYRKIPSSHIKQALKSGDTYQNIMDLLPKTARYVKLKAYLDYLYEIKKHYTPPEFNGDEDEDTIRIKKVFDLLQIANLEEDTIRDEAFEEALLMYQKRHGLLQDGVIGPHTKRTLKTSITQIINKVKKNLTWERISTPKVSEYIFVNIPEFKMYYFKDHKNVLDMKVVLGRTYWRTPIFNRHMKYIVKNPRWNVPPSIYKNEYADKSKEYLEENGFAFNNEGKLYQKSGGKNALGVVKFLFPNKYNVYMHDTPSKSLFNKTVRAFSHGCIRLEKPLELLHMLGHQYDTKKRKWITLKDKIPVYIEYHTVWVDNAGIVQFRDDIYGYEKKLFDK